MGALSPQSGLSRKANSSFGLAKPRRSPVWGLSSEARQTGFPSLPANRHPTSSYVPCQGRALPARHKRVPLPPQRRGRAFNFSWIVHELALLVKTDLAAPAPTGATSGVGQTCAVGWVGVESASTKGRRYVNLGRPVQKSAWMCYTPTERGSPDIRHKEALRCQKVA